LEVFEKESIRGRLTTDAPRRGRRRSGRKKGGRNQETLTKQASEGAYRAFLQAHHQRLWSAALEAACGSFVPIEIERTVSASFVPERSIRRGDIAVVSF
jgi:hypothetical protein